MKKSPTSSSKAVFVTSTAPCTSALPGGTPFRPLSRPARVSALSTEGFNPMVAHADEYVYLDARRHGVALVKPLSRASALAVLGVTAFALGWPLSLVGAALLVAAATVATVAVWRWDRTHV